VKSSFACPSVGSRPGDLRTLTFSHVLLAMKFAVSLFPSSARLNCKRGVSDCVRSDSVPTPGLAPRFTSRVAMAPFLHRALQPEFRISAPVTPRRAPLGSLSFAPVGSMLGASSPPHFFFARRSSTFEGAQADRRPSMCSSVSLHCAGIVTPPEFDDFKPCDPEELSLHGV